MAKVTFLGHPVTTNGELPNVGSKAPAFLLTTKELEDVGLGNFQGKKKLLNIVPSLDTPTCAISTKKFNDYAKEHPETMILVVSADLPFAQSRFCSDESLENVVTLSLMHTPRFTADYGVAIVDGPLKGLAARAIVVMDENDTVRYTELVPEIGDEPNYELAMAALEAI
jgi:thiol peroxidase